MMMAKMDMGIMLIMVMVMTLCWFCPGPNPAHHVEEDHEDDVVGDGLIWQKKGM